VPVDNSPILARRGEEKGKIRVHPRMHEDSRGKGGGLPGPESNGHEGSGLSLGEAIKEKIGLNDQLWVQKKAAFLKKEEISKRKKDQLCAMGSRRTGKIVNTS